MYFKSHLYEEKHVKYKKAYFDQQAGDLQSQNAIKFNHNNFSNHFYHNTCN